MVKNNQLENELSRLEKYIDIHKDQLSPESRAMYDVISKSELLKKTESSNNKEDKNDI